MKRKKIKLSKQKAEVDLTKARARTQEKNHTDTRTFSRLSYQDLKQVSFVD